MSICARQNRSGMVLVVVLVLVLLMGLAAYEYLLSMQTENAAARSSGDHLIAQQAAFSARDLLAAILALPRSQRQGLGDVAENPDVFGGIVLDEDMNLETEDIPIAFVISPEDSTNHRAQTTHFGAENESAKLSLLKLIEWDEQKPGSGREALMRFPGMEATIADALLDWVDRDSHLRFEGAEFDAYASLSTPIRPRNGRPLDLEELLLVRGVDAARLFGRKTEVPPNGRAQSISALDADQPWVRLVTVCSGERNENLHGEPRVLVNDNQLDLLHQRLVERLPVAWANFIVLFRQFGPSLTGDISTSAKQKTAGDLTIDFSQPAQYRIESPLDLLDVRVAVPGGHDSLAIASPFSSEPQMMQSQLPELVDQITVTAETRLEGRININRACREVLLAIPGVDDSLAERILAARTMGDNATFGRHHGIWLLTEGIVDVPRMRELLPNITAGGDVYRAEFWGCLAGRSLAYRCEAVIDATEGVARQVFFRELEPKELPADWKAADSLLATGN